MNTRAQTWKADTYWFKETQNDPLQLKYLIGYLRTRTKVSNEYKACVGIPPILRDPEYAKRLASMSQNQCRVLLPLLEAKWETTRDHWSARMLEESQKLHAELMVKAPNALYFGYLLNTLDLRQTQDVIRWLRGEIKSIRDQCMQNLISIQSSSIQQIILCILLAQEFRYALEL